MMSTTAAAAQDGNLPIGSAVTTAAVFLVLVFVGVGMTEIVLLPIPVLQTFTVFPDGAFWPISIGILQESVGISVGMQNQAQDQKFYLDLCVLFLLLLPD